MVVGPRPSHTSFRTQYAGSGAVSVRSASLALWTSLGVDYGSTVTAVAFVGTLALRMAVLALANWFKNVPRGTPNKSSSCGITRCVVRHAYVIGLL